MDSEELITLIRTDENVRQAILDMLAEEVQLNVELNNNDDCYSNNYGEPSSVEVSIAFGERIEKDEDWNRTWNSNRLVSEDWF